jgi:hypothetical protein
MQKQYSEDRVSEGRGVSIILMSVAEFAHIYTGMAADDDPFVVIYHQEPL